METSPEIAILIKKTLSVKWV